MATFAPATRRGRGVCITDWSGSEAFDIDAFETETPDADEIDVPVIDARETGDLAAEGCAAGAFATAFVPLRGLNAMTRRSSPVADGSSLDMGMAPR